MDLYKAQKQKQQKDYDSPCDCTKWKSETIAIHIDKDTDDVEYEEVCSQCGKELTEEIKKRKEELNK